MIVNQYNKKKIRYDNIKLLKRNGIDRQWISSVSNNRKVKIFWVGNDEHQDRSGFLQSLSKIALVDVFCNETEYGQFWNHRPHELDKKIIQSSKLYKDIENLKEKPDILLMQTWGFRIDVNVIRRIKNDFTCKVINIGMDEKHTYWINGVPEDGTCGLKDVLDVMLTSIPVAVDWFRKENVPCFFFPEASDSDFFFPIDIEKKYDVGLVGENYGIRREIVKILQKQGFNIKVYGDGWPSGRISPNLINEFYNQCKIVLGVGTIGYCNNLFSLKLRDFDVPMSGAFYLTTFCEDLLALYEEDSEIVMYNNMDEIVSKCSYYLEHDEQRDAIAINGYLRALKDHHYDKRFDELIDTIKCID